MRSIRRCKEPARLNILGRALWLTVPSTKLPSSKNFSPKRTGSARRAWKASSFRLCEALSCVSKKARTLRVRDSSAPPTLRTVDVGHRASSSSCKITVCRRFLEPDDFALGGCKL